MTPSEIIARARKKFNVATSLYSDQDALDDLNVVKDDFFASIVSVVNEDYNWDVWTADTVAGQSEYLVPDAARNAVGAMKIRWIAVMPDSKNYDTTTVPILHEARLVTFDSLEKEWNWYLAYQDPAKPLYVVAENSVFVAPLPKNSVTGGIKIRGIKNIEDYTLSTPESGMKIPYNHHEVLVLGLGEYAYSQKAMTNEAANCRAEYERRRDEACRRLGDRVVAPMMNAYPSNSQYQGDAYIGDFPSY